MERVVFLDRESLDAALKRPDFVHEWIDYPQSEPDTVVARLRDATIAVSNKVPLRAAALAQLPSLKLIAVCATGTDNVDLDYCRAHDIAVANVRGYAVHAVPEHVFMLILALRRNLLAYREDVHAGRWNDAPQFCLRTHPIRDLHGATLGVIGHGVLGRAVARLGQAFGMRVLISEHKGVTAPRTGYMGFDTVLRDADVITLHAPLTPATRHLIGAAEIERMRPGAILINAGRGGLVDEAALAQALRRGRIAGAGFDVLSVEPPRAGNPLLDPDLPNFILTPHNAWASAQAQQRMADELVANIEAFVHGTPRNLVT